MKGKDGKQWQKRGESNRPEHAELRRLTLLHVADIWSQLWSGSRDSEEKRLALKAFTWQRQGWWSWRMIQMSVSGQDSHLSWRTGQVTAALSCRESVGKLAMTSHYELGAVLWTWQIPNSSLPWVGVAKGHKDAQVKLGRYDHQKDCLNSVKYGKLALLDQI